MAPPPGADSDLLGNPSGVAPSVDESAWQLLAQGEGPMHSPDHPSNLAATRTSVNAPATQTAAGPTMNVNMRLQSAAQSAAFQDNHV